MIVKKEIGFVPQDTTITLGNPVFIDCKNAPFKIYGVNKDTFARMPVDVAKRVSPSVEHSSQTSNGGRLRFRTDSDYVVVHAKIKDVSPNFQQAKSDACGIDMLAKTGKDWFVPGTCIPSQGDGKDYIEYRTRFDKSFKMKEILLHFPIETRIESLSIALREGSVLEEPTEYKNTNPVVFYGSSITFGACASKPSNTYCAMVSRMLDTDFINLGFGGACKAEDSMIDYLKNLKMSVFVYDYDHNAPTPEYLEQTHFRGYCRFREKQPDTPVIFASKPDYSYDIFTYDKDVNKVRRRIIMKSYEQALKLGDKNVSFVDGKKIYPKDVSPFCSVDGCHPNDLGYMYMAKAFSKAIREFIEKD